MARDRRDTFKRNWSMNTFDKYVGICLKKVDKYKVGARIKDGGMVHLSARCTMD